MTDMPQSAAFAPEAFIDPQSALSFALEAGFDDARLLPLPYKGEAEQGARLRDFIDSGRAASMHYLARANEQGELLRNRVAAAFPWARSVLVCWKSYHRPLPRSTDPAPSGAGWIARYAWSSATLPGGGTRPSDYHKVLRRRINALEASLHARYGDFEARGFVDTGPVLERALAAASGLGWIGKNCCLIHPRLGSYGFLSVLLLGLPVEREVIPQLHPDRCGSCRRCIEVCPTQALLAPRQMDASRCIAYLTIEHKEPIEADLRPLTGRQIFGCDLCQDVCPWNRKAPALEDPELAPRPELVNPSLAHLAALTEVEYELLANGSPLRRPGYAGWRRNLVLAMGNSRLKSFIPLLKQWLDEPDPAFDELVRWAIVQCEE